MQASRSSADAVRQIGMGAGTGGAGWASAHPGKNQGGHGPPWKFQPWSENFLAIVRQ